MPRKKTTTIPEPDGIVTGPIREFDTEDEADIGTEMDQTTTPKKIGRPFKSIDQDEFEKLCQMQCTQSEICGWFSVDDKTLTGWCARTYGQSFSEIFAQKRQGGKASLRRRQWIMSETNPTMAIWLGKQYLGQSDDPQKLERERTAEDRLCDFVDALSEAVSNRRG